MAKRIAGLSTAAAAMLGTMMFSLAANAQSVAQCQQQCSIAEGMCKGIGDGRDASCIADADACSYQCVLKGSSSRLQAGAPPKFGAIAFSAQTRAQGFSYDWADRASAEASAMKACRSNRTPAPKDCAVAIWFYNNCGALSTSDDGGWGASYAGSQRQAEANAVQHCRSLGGTSCALRRSFCTGL